MGAQDLNQKYTIDKYCSRNEVARAIGTNLIEPLWNEIIKFRKMYSRPLQIKDSFNVPFELTYLANIENNVNKINEKFSAYIVNFGKLIDGTIAKHTVTYDMLKNSLKNIAIFNKIDASEITLQNVVDHVCYDSNYVSLTRYLTALERLYSRVYEEINEEFLANYYAILRGEEELTSFYRLNDNTSNSSRFLVGREFDNGVPAHMIEDMMNNYINYVNSDSVGKVEKIVATFFMFNYIKPFDEYNDEMAAIIAKRIIAEGDVGASSVFVPIEKFINDDVFYYTKMADSKRSHDFTYCFLRGAEIIDESLLTILDRIVQVNANALDVTNYLGDDPEAVKKEFGIDIGENVIEKKEIIERAETQQVVVKPAPKIQKPIENPDILSEKELKKQEEEILESDPFIKKGQAHFYVRHCTKGHFYTIQQYKKAEGVVYETARTSMDNLAMRGYYRREQIKNKFVYTPIDKE